MTGPSCTQFNRTLGREDPISPRAKIGTVTHKFGFALSTLSKFTMTLPTREDLFFYRLADDRKRHCNLKPRTPSLRSERSITSAYSTTNESHCHLSQLVEERLSSASDRSNCADQDDASTDANATPYRYSFQTPRSQEGFVQLSSPPKVMRRCEVVDLDKRGIPESIMLPAL
jgi:hypothetical protein